MSKFSIDWLYEMPQDEANQLRRALRGLSDEDALKLWEQKKRDTEALLSKEERIRRFNERYDQKTK